VEYRSLKEIYSEQVMLKRIPILPRQQVKRLFSEQDLLSTQDVPAEPVPTEPVEAQPPTEQPQALESDFDPTQIKDWTTWASVGVPNSLFYEEERSKTNDKSKKKKTGRGEYSVASFLSGLKTRKEIDKENIVQGASKTFDIMYGGREYEVKEITDKGVLDVRIGAEGSGTSATLKEGLITATKSIRKLYTSLTKEAQEEVNGLLRKKFNKEKFNINVYLSKFSEKNLREVPLGLIADPHTFVTAQSPLWGLEPSILTLLNAILGLDSSQTMSNTPGAKNSRIQALLDLVSKKDMYGIDDEDSEFNKEIEKELEVLDQDLISKRCEYSGDEKYCTTLDTFVQEIKNKNFMEDVRNLINIFRGDVLSIFPKEASFGGLFIVDATKFKYIPKTQLTNFIENYRISQGNPKIRLKK